MIVFTGPPGAGKDTLIDASGHILDDRFPGEFTRVKTSTTRPMRVDEFGKPDRYDRYSVDEFNRRWKAGEFVERNFYSGNHYGLRWERVKEAHLNGRCPMATLDFNGAASVLWNEEPWIVETRLILFIDAPSQKELRRRMIIRNDNIPPHDLEERLRIAERERAEATRLSHRITRIVNDDRERAIREAVDAVIRHRQRVLAIR